MARGKEPTWPCRRYGFDPWVRKIPWRRKWQPTPVFLPGEFQGQTSLVGYSPWGCKELDTAEWLALSLSVLKKLLFGSSDALNGQQEANDYISSLHGLIPRSFHSHLYMLLHLILQKAGIYVRINSNMTIVSINFLIRGTWVPSTIVSLSTI